MTSDQPLFAVGFTGTQGNLTQAQWLALDALLMELNPYECHHGDCIGADYSFHTICLKQQRHIILHPPINGSKRAYSRDATDSRLPREYLQRNQDIVNETKILIACPGTATEQQRSGTWSTVRYARKLRRPIYLILPNGQIQKENIDASHAAQVPPAVDRQGGS